LQTYLVSQEEARTEIFEKGKGMEKQIKMGFAAGPFVKWAGSKSQLLEEYTKLLPTSFENYLEPFVGGGAVFFSLHSQGKLKGNVTLGDLNEELMNCYGVIRDDVEELIAILRKHDAHKMDRAYYYDIRDYDRDGRIESMTAAERAARTIFLNRTCYNGLYRVNKKGQFNVPYGRHKNPTVCDEQNLRVVSQALQGVELLIADFEDCVSRARQGDFIYLDPPYHPLSSTAYFTNYTKENFDEKEQERLARVFRNLDARGCFIMLSNSDTELVRQEYQEYKSIKVEANRAISCKVSTRKAVSELVIVNYDVETVEGRESALRLAFAGGEGHE